MVKNFKYLVSIVNRNHEEAFIAPLKNNLPIQHDTSKGGYSVNSVIKFYVSSYIHSHFSDSLSLSIFSGGDFHILGALFNNKLINTSKFVMGVTTASGTNYFMTINDDNSFMKFYNKYLSSKVSYLKLENKYDDYNIDSKNSVGNNELGFLMMLTKESTGISLLKTDSNCENANILSLSSDKKSVIQTPCVNLLN